MKVYTAFVAPPEQDDPIAIGFEMHPFLVLLFNYLYTGFPIVSLTRRV